MPQSNGYSNPSTPQGLSSLNEILLGNAWMSSCRASLQSKIWPDPQSMANIFAALPGEYAPAQCGGYAFSNPSSQYQPTAPPFCAPHIHGFAHGPAHPPAESFGPNFSSRNECAGDGSGAARTPSSPSSACVNKIFPRRKAGQSFRLNSKPVVLDEKVRSPFVSDAPHPFPGRAQPRPALNRPPPQVLGRFFDLPLHEAAVQLGISATAMKSACRSVSVPAPALEHL